MGRVAAKKTTARYGYSACGRVSLTMGGKPELRRAGFSGAGHEDSKISVINVFAVSKMIERLVR
ncbi:MAG: hypothetical protein LBU13_09870 [Synergistaceae bacterium]|jgi:hypothetical protein|nr:hypothetical protein [Synergistaceae bacterium]